MGSESRARSLFPILQNMGPMINEILFPSSKSLTWARTYEQKISVQKTGIISTGNSHQNNKYVSINATWNTNLDDMSGAITANTITQKPSEKLQMKRFGGFFPRMNLGWVEDRIYSRYFLFSEICYQKNNISNIYGCMRSLFFFRYWRIERLLIAIKNCPISIAIRKMPPLTWKIRKSTSQHSIEKNITVRQCIVW